MCNTTDQNHISQQKREERLLPPPIVVLSLSLRLISARTYFVTVVTFYFGVVTDLETVSFVIRSAFS